jgi:8-amino-7-oxononanoate synthase
MLNDVLRKKLYQRESLGNLRTLKTESSLIDLTSNDYLGFAKSQDLKKEIVREWEFISEKYPSVGFGATGSRLLTGNNSYCEDLENAIAQFHGSEAALIFNSGYTANSGLVSALASSSDTILFDSHIHASMHDGIQKSKARSLPFQHNDVEHLEKRLKNTQNTTFVCIESIYSIDGSMAPCKEISALCNSYGAYLLVDEAHAIGIAGERGEGIVSHLGLQDRVFAWVCTFGKALGAQGAVILGSSLLKQYLINFSIPFIYTTALPMHSLAAIKCAYQRLPQANAERQQLKKLQHGLFAQAAQTGCPLLPTNTPIVPIFLPGNDRVKALSQELALEGFDIRPILSPTVRKGKECLRLCLHAFNTLEEIDALLRLLPKKVT